MQSSQSSPAKSDGVPWLLSPESKASQSLGSPSAASAGQKVGDDHPMDTLFESPPCKKARMATCMQKLAEPATSTSWVERLQLLAAEQVNLIKAASQSQKFLLETACSGLGTPAYALKAWSCVLLTLAHPLLQDASHITLQTKPLSEE